MISVMENNQERSKKRMKVRMYVPQKSNITLKKVQNFLYKNNEGIRWFDSEKDKHLEKGLQTWKENNLKKIMEKEINNLFPKLDPRDIKIKELEAGIERLKNENRIHALTNRALKTAIERNLPVNIVCYFVGEDEAETDKNLGILEETIKEIMCKTS